MRYGGRLSPMCPILWGPCRVLGKLSAAWVLIQGYMTHPLRNYTKLCVSADACISWGGEFPASRVGPADLIRVNSAPPLRSGVPDILLSLGLSSFLWAALLLPTCPLPRPALSPPPWLDLLSAPMSLGPCTHPARSDTASSPRPSPGRPCCSRSACGGQP